MKNKLGMNESLVEDIERKIVGVKLALLDEMFTFNNEKLDIEYMKKLNDFLFSSIYYEEQLGIRKEIQEQICLINDYLDEIIYLSTYHKEEVMHILEVLQKIWELQPFNIGNTRTLLAFLKVLNEAFKLNLDIDLDKEISSGSSIFILGNLVNQNRLTKFK